LPPPDADVHPYRAPSSTALASATRLAVSRAVFAEVRAIAGADTTWMGSSDPQSLLHAPGKWPWWAGGGDQGTAVVVTDRKRLDSRGFARLCRSLVRLTAVAHAVA
jgi:hypothetical protein